MQSSALKKVIKEANRKAGIDRQRTFSKKSVVQQTADQVIDNLCARAQDVLDAYYKDQGPEAVRESMRNLQTAIRIAQKRVRQ